ncbi:MAG TPA: hypothetical protein VNA29_06250 [Sphingomicrobium sp.]|nr:hypothetical protein [Sphingomicrobium sp.]
MEILIPLGLFTALVLITGQLARLLSGISLQRTLREALRHSPGSVPILADKLEARQPEADALLGWIFIAFAIGMVLMGLFETADERREIIQGAIVPLAVGLVVLAYVGWAKRKGSADGPAPVAAPMPKGPAAPTAPREPTSRGRRSVRRPA